MSNLLTGRDGDFARMEMALKEAFENTGFCFVCHRHDHASSCLLFDEGEEDEEEEGPDIPGDQPMRQDVFVCTEDLPYRKGYDYAQWCHPDAAPGEACPHCGVETGVSDAHTVFGVAS